MAGSRQAALKAWRTIRANKRKKGQVDWRAAGLKAWRTRQANLKGGNKSLPPKVIKAIRVLAKFI